MTNRALRKIIFHGSAIVIYVGLIVAVSSELSDSHKDPPALETRGSAGLVDRIEPLPSALLLPLAPDENRLPGLPAVWDAFRSAGGGGTTAVANGDFHGLQAVERYTDLSRHAAAEIYLSFRTKQVFHRERDLLILDDRGRVQILDCEPSRALRLAGILPYEKVRHMAMRGDAAYLLSGSPGSPHDVIVVADLAQRDAPRELARLAVPKDAAAFFFTPGRLIVSVISPSSRARSAIHLYDLTPDHQLIALGSIPSSLLDNGFLKFGDYLLVPDLRDGLHVCDFSDPFRPVVVSSLAVADTLRNFAVRGETLFALGSQKRIHVIDLHDPRRPVLTFVAENTGIPVFFISHGNDTYYFTQQGSILVIPLPADRQDGSESLPIAPNGTLMASPGEGFLLLDSAAGALPAGVTRQLSLPDPETIRAVAAWREGLAVLHDEGHVRFYAGEDASLPVVRGAVQLAGQPRWLAAGSDRLYAGGQGGISVIGYDHEQPVVTGHIALPGVDTWAGLVIRQTLCVAAGPQGLLSFSLAAPDQPAALGSWGLPAHLAGRADVRHLAAAGEGRVLVGAGAAGLVDGRVDAQGRFRLKGLVALPAPTKALAVLNRVGLVATPDQVLVIDIGGADSLQVLGDIPFAGVTRLAVAPPDQWAGLVAGQGWSILAAPRLLAEQELARLGCVEVTGEESAPTLFRLHFFDDQGARQRPGRLHCAGLPAGRLSGGVQNDH